MIPSTAQGFEKRGRQGDVLWPCQHRFQSLVISHKIRIETTMALSCACLSCAWMIGKKEFSAVVVKAFKSSFQLFSVPDGDSGQSVGSWSWRGTRMVRGLISERSYPWAVEPAGLNGSIRPIFSGEGSAGPNWHARSSSSKERSYLACGCILIIEPGPVSILWLRMSGPASMTVFSASQLP